MCDEYRVAEETWLPFLDTYRLAPSPDFRQVLEEVRAL